MFQIKIQLPNVAIFMISENYIAQEYLKTLEANFSISYFSKGEFQNGHNFV